MASTHFVGGFIWSPAQEEAPRPGEVLVVDGRIAGIGNGLVVDEGVERLDLAGGTLIPAFGDGHAHPLQAGIERRFANVRGDSISLILGGVREWADQHPQEPWIYGGGFDLSLTPDGIFDAQWLDAVEAVRPVVLQGTDYHTMWCNSEALRRSGITAATPDPPDGEIVRRADGSPIGTLREWGATDPVFAAMPKPDPAMQVTAIDEATALCAAVGLTWIQDAWVEPEEVPAYLTAAGTGALRIAANLAFRVNPTRWPEQIAEFGRLRARVQRAGHPHLTALTVKFFVDGVIESGTAALLEPYLDCPHSHGLPNWAADELLQAVESFSEHGFQVHLHAIGDAAVRMSLDAIEASAPVIRAQDLRPVVAHLQLIDAADLRRLAALGVICCFQPLWAQPDPLQEVLTVPRIGAVRGAAQYQIGSLANCGATLSFGSDWPVTELSPQEGIATAVTRQTPGGEPADGWYPAERISLRQALTAYTRGVAMQGFRDEAGVLSLGAPADLVWLGADLTELDVATLRSAPVLGTWMAGRRIH